MEANKSTAPGSGTFYGLGDSDFIEDMAIRTQMYRPDHFDAPWGPDETVMEVRFRLLEDKAEDLADKLMVVSGEKGAWKTEGKVFVTDLVPEDVISIRVSSSGVLKPGEGQANATVLDPPVLIGANEAGVNVYPVRVAAASGAVGEVDMELRSTPSIQRMTYDPNQVVKVTSKAVLSSKAVNAGWVTGTVMGYEGEDGTVSVDATGAKKSSKYVHGVSGGAIRATRTMDSGAMVSANLAHKTTGSTAHGSPRRSDYAGWVTIKVPMEGKTDEQVAATISEAMEAVGIPPDKQDAPSKEELARLAINKINTNFAPDFQHRRQANASGLPGDPGTAEVLGKLDAVVGTYLGRKTTLDDIRFHTYPDGRMQVVVSDEVADAISQRQGFTYYQHGFSASIPTLDRDSVRPDQWDSVHRRPVQFGSLHPRPVLQHRPEHGCRGSRLHVREERHRHQRW